MAQGQNMVCIYIYMDIYNGYIWIYIWYGHHTTTKDYSKVAILVPN